MESLKFWGSSNKIEGQKNAAGSGIFRDDRQAEEEDEKAKRRSERQLAYLFDVCDTVCFHAEEGVCVGDETDERFAEIMQSAFRTEEIENRGMRVLRVYLKPTPELKSYLSSFAHFDRYHFDCYERFAPYVSFADIVFLQNGIPLLNCLTHEGYFDVHESIRDVFAGFEKD